MSTQVIEHAPCAIEKFCTSCISLNVWIVLSRSDHLFKLIVLSSQIADLIFRSVELLFECWLLDLLTQSLRAKAKCCKLFVPLLPFLRCVSLQVLPVTSVGLLFCLLALCCGLHWLVLVNFVGPTLDSRQRCLNVAVLARLRISIEAIGCSDRRLSTFLNHLFITIERLDYDHHRCDFK